MYITMTEFETLETALNSGKKTDIKKALTVIQVLKEKHTADNKRKYAFISEKRKTDKTYANKRKKV